MPGRGDIRPYHNKVASDVTEILGEAVTFYPSDDEEWYKVRDGSGVEFDLVPADPVKSELATRMRRESGQSYKVSVFSLSTPSSSYLGTFWVSWHESWSKENSANYLLVNAGWTLFEGVPGNQDKNQVLRVDWDQLPHRRSNRAGHPHWHFDHELFISGELDKIEIAPGLVEVTAESPFTMAKQASVGFIHLAMGAWNEHTNHPECWQRTYEDDCQRLRDWCIKTLKYLKDQVGGS